MPISRQTTKVKSPHTIIMVWAVLLVGFWVAFFASAQALPEIMINVFEFVSMHIIQPNTMALDVNTPVATIGIRG